MNKYDKFFIGCTFFISFPEAHAYLDPGTGSMLLSVFIGLASSAYFAIRKLPRIIKQNIFRLKNDRNVSKKNNIVIYVESAAYWNTFAPLLSELASRNIEVLYLTSNEKDKVFEKNYPSCIKSKYIGTGTSAYSLLNFMEAKVMVLTTPGLDVLQIKRSKGVKKYIHVVHSLVDCHTYKYFSFDYYDEVICSSEPMKKSILSLEKERKTNPKNLPIIGCPYIDNLIQRINSQNIDVYTNKKSESNAEVCILLAPTWGKNGLLTRIGSNVPKILAETGHKVIFRPHPQSFISEKELMNQLEKELAQYKNLVWDKNPDNFNSLNEADILISDLSGIIFDFTFCFLKPAITVAYDTNPDGFEAFDIPHPIWELSILDTIGARLTQDNLDQLPQTINKLVSSSDIKNTIIKLRNETFPNFGNSAKPIVDEILQVAEGVSND